MFDFIRSLEPTYISKNVEYDKHLQMAECLTIASWSEVYKNRLTQCLCNV